MPQKPKFKLKNIKIDCKKIGQHICKIRKINGLTQKELASKIGVSQRLISDYEIGRVKISANMLCHFAFALDVNPNILLGFNKSNNSEKEISLRFTKRIHEINKLPENKKKFILKTIDDLILAAKNQ